MTLRHAMRTTLLVLAQATLAATAQAHGGLSMDQDKCKLQVGRYLMHFAGYQEDAQRTEFCEDIPHKGRTIVVLDFVDDALRDLPVGVEIRRRSDGVAVEQGELVYQLPPRTYAKGTLTLTHEFRTDGDYVGLVHAGDRRQHAAVFPFSVGRDRTAHWLMLGSAALVAVAAVGYAVARRRWRLDVARGADAAAGAGT